MSSNVSEIITQLERLTRDGHSPFAIFADWLSIMIASLSGDEDEYASIVRKYRSPEPQDSRGLGYFCKAFASLMLEMKKSNCDVLGDVYMQWNMSNKLRGQFFTPAHIASFMAQFVNPLGGKILDPACGSGVMLVESIKLMNQEQLESAVFFGQDIDFLCAQITALNLCFFNVSGYAIHGDTLSLECKTVFETSRSVYGGSIRQLRGNDHEEFKERYVSMVKHTVSEKPNQTPVQYEIVFPATK